MARTNFEAVFVNTLRALEYGHRGKRIMINFKKSASLPKAGILASSRFSEPKKGGKGAIWFESSVHRLEDQGDEVYVTPDSPPSERVAPPDEIPPSDAAGKREK